MKTRTTSDMMFVLSDAKATINRTPSGYVDLMFPIAQGVSAHLSMLQTEAADVAKRLLALCNEVDTGLVTTESARAVCNEIEEAFELGRWVLVGGDIIDGGLRIMGPFSSQQEAETYAEAKGARVLELLQREGASEGEATTTNEALDSLVAEIESTGWHNEVSPAKLAEGFKGHAPQLTLLKAALSDRAVTKDQRQSILRHMNGVAMSKLSTVIAEVLLDAEALGAEEEPAPEWLPVVAERLAAAVPTQSKLSGQREQGELFSEPKSEEQAWLTF